jgi:RNA polymerase sigma-70 factor (ECF subfamily)
MNAELIKQAKVDPEAFGELYEEFYEGIYKFVYLRVNEQALTEDLVSQIWEKTLSQLPTLKGNEPEVFRAWIFTLARHSIADHFRRHREAQLPEDFDTAAPDSPVQDFKDQELADAVTIALLGLPQLEREMVSLKIFGDLSNKDIAQVLGKPERTVGAYLSRALKHLQKRLSYHLKYE